MMSVQFEITISRTKIVANQSMAFPTTNRATVLAHTSARVAAEDDAPPRATGQP